MTGILDLAQWLVLGATAGLDIKFLLLEQPQDSCFQAAIFRLLF